MKFANWITSGSLENCKWFRFQLARIKVLIACSPIFFFLCQRVTCRNNHKYKQKVRFTFKHEQKTIIQVWPAICSICVRIGSICKRVSAFASLKLFKQDSKQHNKSHNFGIKSLIPQGSYSPLSFFKSFIIF